MDIGIKGKMCIVTGGSRGIGLEVAQVLASEGADVALLARDGTRLEAAAAEIRKSGTRAFPVVADLSTEAGVTRGISTLIVTGIATNVAVDHTIRDAVQIGYNVILPEDCCCSSSPAHHEAALLTLRVLATEVTDTETLLSVIG